MRRLLLSLYPASCKIEIRSTTSLPSSCHPERGSSTTESKGLHKSGNTRPYEVRVDLPEEILRLATLAQNDKLWGFARGSGITRAQIALKLGVTQQAVAQAERWDSNPSIAFIKRWADACNHRLELQLTPT